jgi:transcriptional regulator CtsR
LRNFTVADRRELGGKTKIKPNEVTDEADILTSLQNEIKDKLGDESEGTNEDV